MRVTNRFLAAPLVLALALLPACGGNATDATPEGADPKNSRGDGADRPEEPRFRGTVPPGLAKEPSWSLSDVREAYVLGDTVALHRRGDGPMFTFHDLETGEPTGKLQPKREVRDALANGSDSLGDPDYARVRAGSWHGEPVLYLNYALEQASDGLTAEGRFRVIDAYDAAGERVGSIDQDDIGTDRFGVVNGWVLRTDDGGSEGPAITSANGDPVLERICDENREGDCGVRVDLNRSEFGTEAYPTIIDDVAFVSESRGDRQGSRLHAIDLETGEQLWDSDGIDAPDGIPEVTGLNAYPVAAVGDSGVILHWRHETGMISAGSFDTTIAVHDLRTGELTLTGPTLEVQDGSNVKEPPRYLIDDEAGVAVLTGSPTAYRSAAFDLDSGELLWQQDASESELRAYTILGDVLFGFRETNDSKAIAIRLRDRKVLEEDFGDALTDDGPAAVPVPRAVLGGTAGLLRHRGSVFVFPATD